MSWTLTSNFGLKKIDFDTEENTWGGILNENYDTIDTNLGVGGGSFLYAVIKDVKPSGTEGGTSAAGVWQTRDLNTLNTNVPGITLVSNQFTLPAGTYKIEASCPATRIDFSKIALRNVTDSVFAILGSSEIPHSIAETTTQSSLVDVITLLVSKTFEIQHYTDATFSPYGLGRAGVDGEIEVYTQVFIEKVG